MRVRLYNGSVADRTALSLPWELLVQPAATWRRLQLQPYSWPAILTQGLLLYAGWLLAARPMLELQAVAIGSDPQTPAALAGLALPLFALALALGLAGVLWLWFSLLGLRFGYRQMLVWSAYGLLPLYLGRALGLLSFAIIRPLAETPLDALALTINPLSLGLAGLFEPLSYPWVLGSAFDLFGVWSVLLLALGARHFLELHGSRRGWVLVALLLLFLLVLTALWRGLQAGIA